MELQRALAKLPPHRMIYLGSRVGSGFLDIDRAGIMLCNLGELNTRFYNNLQDSIERQETAINDIQRFMRECDEDIKTLETDLPRLQAEKVRALDRVASLCHKDPSDERAMQLLEQARARVRRVNNDIETLPERLKEAKEKPKQLEYRLSIARQRMETLLEKRKAWKPLQEKQVLEAYVHTVEIPGLTLIVEGDIDGSIWFYHEKEGKKNGRRKNLG